MLIGTMNPEEGELRPQLLDRFGLTVDVRASRDVDVRAEVIRRADGLRGRPGRGSPPAMPSDEAELARRIAEARARIADVVLGGQRVTPDRDAVRGVRRRRDARRSGGGPHRRRARRVGAGADGSRAGPRTSGLPPNWRCRTGAGVTRSTSRAWTRTCSTRRWPHSGDSEPEPGARPARWRRWPLPPSETPAPQGDSGPAPHAPPPRPSAAPAPVFRTRALRVPGVGEGAPGRRSRARNRTGAVVGVSPDDAGGSTVAAPVRHADVGGRPDDRPAVGCGRRPTTSAARSGRAARATWWCSSSTRPGSMAARDRMSAVSGAALSLLRDAYQRRDQVAVDHVPRRRRAACCCRRRRRPTSRAAGWPDSTPAARRRWPQGLLAARDLVARQKVAGPVAAQPGRGAHRRPRHRRARPAGPGPVGRRAGWSPRAPPRWWWTARRPTSSSGLAGELAGWLGAPVLRLAQLRADHSAHAVRSIA